MGGLIKFLEDMKYERPKIYYAGMMALLVVIFIAAFMMLPPVPILRAIGVTGAQTRLGAAVNAVYWQARVMFNEPGNEEPVKEYGNLLGISKSGQVVVQVVDGTQWVTKEYGVADTPLIDLYGSAKIVSALTASSARFDVYEKDQVVIWVRGEPLNVRFVEAGVAKPDPSPPTNIVDAVFAAYYWTVAAGKTKGIEQ